MKFSFLLFSLLFVNCLSHGQSALRQTTGSAGNSRPFNYGDSQLTIQYSVAQASIIGKGRLQDIQIRQGFIQPMGAKSIRLSDQNNLEAIVYPNPFHRSFQIEFTEHLSADVFIIDLMGRELYRATIQEANRHQIVLENIAQGTYILLIQSGYKVYKGQIIKY